MTEKLIPLPLIKALAGEPIPVYGDGRNVRDYVKFREDKKHTTKDDLTALKLFTLP